MEMMPVSSYCICKESHFAQTNYSLTEALRGEGAHIVDEV